MSIAAFRTSPPYYADSLIVAPLTEKYRGDFGVYSVLTSEVNKRIFRLFIGFIGSVCHVEQFDAVCSQRYRVESAFSANGCGESLVDEFERFVVTFKLDQCALDAAEGGIVIWLDSYYGAPQLERTFHFTGILSAASESGDAENFLLRALILFTRLCQSLSRRRRLAQTGHRRREQSDDKQNS